MARRWWPPKWLAVLATRTLRLGPNDVLVVTIPTEQMQVDTTRRIKAVMEGLGIPRARVLVKTEREELSTIHMEAEDAG